MTQDAVRIPLVVEPALSLPMSARAREPVTFGLPIPAGRLPTTDGLAIVDDRGVARAVQARVLERWTDGSVRWLLVDTQIDAPATGTRVWLTTSAEAPAGAPPIHVDESAETITVGTGPAVFTLRRGPGAPLIRVTPQGALDLQVGGPQTAGAPDLQVRGSSGAIWPLSTTTIAIEERGPLRVTVRADGHARGERGRSVALTWRLTFLAASPVVRIAIALTNPDRARHPGGFWELGDPGSLYFEDVSIILPVTSPPDGVACSPESGMPLVDAALPFEIYQESSGGEAWQSPVHINRDGVVPHALQGYRMRRGAAELRHGRRASPIVRACAAGGIIGMAMPHFWEAFPQAIEVRDTELAIRLFPGQYPDAHELQGGERTTHTFVVAFGDDTVSDPPLDWVRAPLLVHADAEWYAAAEPLPFLTPADTDPSRAYVALVATGLEGPSSFDDKRETIDEFGWRHFGDIYGDHEAVGHTGPQPLVSHYNNQYDPVMGFAGWFFRTGDVRWWRHMRDLAGHVMDVDVYHTHADKAAYNSGLFWHTAHYRDAGRATHRSYPRGAAGVFGGGPSAEHSYATGLLIYGFLTGDPMAREAVIGMGEWLLSAEDGTRSRFRWIDSGPTGLTSSSGSPLYHGPGRGGGNAISVLVDCHRLTGDDRFIRGAEMLIRRCMHPAQDVAALDLLDAERRWYYTMFLQAVGKYLRHQDERGVHDAMFGYAQASLLHFTRWMAAHERPYLDHPEILEYPNETWAAQDMRKSEVFQWAALHAAGDERRLFLERAGFFFDYAVRTLTNAPTRTLARPMVLLLANGPAHAWFVRHAERLPPAPQALAWPAGWQPVAFVPQKVRAMRRARLATLAAAMLTAIALFLFSHVCGPCH